MCYYFLSFESIFHGHNDRFHIIIMWVHRTHRICHIHSNIKKAAFIFPEREHCVNQDTYRVPLLY